MNCNLKTFELTLNMLKFNLQGSLNFERTPLKLQTAVKSNNGEREKSCEGGKGKEGARQFDFLGRNSSRPQAYNSPEIFYAVAHLGSSQSGQFTK
jgi:hypothetical protein